MKFEEKMENMIFASRWLQAPLYVGLVVASVLYVYKFIMELIHLSAEIHSISEEHLMMGVLTLIDFVMIGNLLVMVVIGGYATFVSKIAQVDNHEDRPDWLDHIDAGTLKIKMAGALVGISGIHLLKTFINIAEWTSEKVLLQVLIHGIFLLSALMLAWTEKVMAASKHH